MITLVNGYGRKFEELDAIKLRLAASEQAAKIGAISYHVVSEDGTPMLGLVATAGGPKLDLIAKGWVRQKTTNEAENG